MTFSAMMLLLLPKFELKLKSKSAASAGSDPMGRMALDAIVAATNVDATAFLMSASGLAGVALDLDSELS